MATDIDDYLAAVPEPARSALEQLRRTIRVVVPDATEVISYRVPTFRYRGKPLVGFGGNQGGGTFYLLSSEVLKTFTAEVKGYRTGKGSIRFGADEPLPATLVTKLVKARIAENEALSRSRRRAR